MEKATTQAKKALGEEPIWVRIGKLPVKVLPLTLYQVWEIGSILESAEITEIDTSANAITEAFKDKSRFKTCFEVILTMIFRSKWKRWVLRRYIKNHLQMTQYREIMTFSFASFNAAFFLSSFIFLKGVRKASEPTLTPEATPHGDLLEEL